MEHIHLEQCKSTQEEVFERFNNIDLLISANKQNQGRGQRDKSWFSTSNSLAMSFNLDPAHTYSLTSLEMGVLVSRFIKEFYNLSLKLKWPNDLIYQDLKVGGILLQKKDILVCGIGLNIFHNEKFPKDLSHATFLMKENMEIKELASSLYHFIFNNRLSDKEIINEFKEKCIHMNKRVKILEADKVYQGEFINIGIHGEAIVKINNEKKSFFSASLTY